MCQTLDDFAIAFDVRQIFRTGYQGKKSFAAFGSATNLNESQAVTGCVQLPEVTERLVVSSQPEIGADRKTQHRLGRRNRSLLSCSMLLWEHNCQAPHNRSE